jgi:hypothetical protein
MSFVKMKKTARINYNKSAQMWRVTFVEEQDQKCFELLLINTSSSTVIDKDGNAYLEVKYYQYIVKNKDIHFF